MQHIKTGDMVKIISGKNKGKTGKVIQVMKNNAITKVVVEGVNELTKHMRARTKTEKGQKITLPAPIASSKVMVIDASKSKPTRVGYRLEGGKKVRVAKRTGSVLA